MRQHKSKCKKTLEHAARSEDKGKVFGVHEYKYSLGKWIWLSSQPVEPKSLAACDVSEHPTPSPCCVQDVSAVNSMRIHAMFNALPYRRTAASKFSRAVI